MNVKIKIKVIFKALNIETEISIVLHCPKYFEAKKTNFVFCCWESRHMLHSVSVSVMKFIIEAFTFNRKFIQRDSSTKHLSL